MCMIYSPIMSAAQASKAPRLGNLEIAIIILLAVVCLILALHGRGRRIRRAAQVFIATAPKVDQALEAFAKDHGGLFPPDAMHVGRPAGLSDKYIHWKHEWNIDYEVHENGKGAKYICLEWCGPQPTPFYKGLCNQPQIRRKYSRGQPIPNQLNRIWLVRESARTLDLAAKDQGKQ